MACFGMMMSGDVLCLYGAGGHGRVIARQARSCGWQTIVFADAGKPLGQAVAGFPVRFAGIDMIEADAVLIAIGDNAIRRQRQEEALAAGHNLAVLIAEPSRHFGEAPGAGTVILAGSVVNDAARLGSGVIVNTAAVVEHDAVVGDFAHVAPGAVLGGGARLGQQSLLGSNATILPGVSVGDNITVGAGAVVTDDLVEPGVYVGVPARRISPKEQARQS